MSEQAFESWEDFDWASTGLLSEAVGWGRAVNLDDDAAVLAWAREYLPRILDHGKRRPDSTSVAS